MDFHTAKYYIEAAKKMLSREYLMKRLERELSDLPEETHYIPYSHQRPVTEKMYPLGILFHIAAGNMDALPAFSVLEGLLTGNINILKLPSADGGDYGSFTDGTD